METELLTVKEIAAKLGKSENVIRVMISKRKIKPLTNNYPKRYSINELLTSKPKNLTKCKKIAVMLRVYKARLAEKDEQIKQLNETIRLIAKYRNTCPVCRNTH